LIFLAPNNSTKTSWIASFESVIEDLKKKAASRTNSTSALNISTGSSSNSNSGGGGGGGVAQHLFERKPSKRLSLNISLRSSSDNNK
jgi:hypothetical protein